MDTKENRLAGGPLVYLAALGTSLPVLNGASVVWANNNVQTITKTGTVSGGTATIEVVYPDGHSETTAAIAFDAAAATIQAALVALASLAGGDVTVTGGPFSTNPVVITFAGAYANTAMGVCNVNFGSITGGGSLACAVTTAGRLWTELPDVVKDVQIKPAHKTQDHTPAFAPHPTGSTTVSMGIESIMFDIEESDLDAFNIGMSSSLLVLTPAGAGQVSLQTLTQPLPADADAAVYQLALVYNGPKGSTGWGQIDHYFRVKRDFSSDRKFGTGTVRTVRLAFSVFADPTQGYRCHKEYEYQAAATS